MNKAAIQSHVPLNDSWSWEAIETVLLDLDGTLLDKYFDDYFWEKYVPQVFARKHGLSAAAAEQALLARYRSVESTLQWTDLNYWTRQLGLDIAELKREIDHLINIHDHVLEFLAFVKSLDKQLCLVTNAHPTTLEIKLAKTNIGHFFDRMICAEEIGEAKEQPQFWQGLENVLDFDKTRSFFADDTEKVLQAADRYGIKHLVHIAKPSSRIEVRYSPNYHSISDFRELMVK